MSIQKWTCRHQNYSTLPQIKHFSDLNTFVALLLKKKKSKFSFAKKEATKKLPD